MAKRETERIFFATFSMDDPFFVGDGERGGKLPDDAQGVFAVERALFANPRLERLAFEILHHHVRRAVGELAEVVDFDQAGVVDKARRACFVHEALDRALVGRKLWMQHLDGDPLVDRLVLGFVDGAHAALSQKPDDAVLADALADEWAWPRTWTGRGGWLGAHGRFGGTLLYRTAKRDMALGGASAGLG